MTKKRQGDMRNIILLPIFLAIAAILGGTIFLTGVGTFANGTAGNACKNCQASTKTMLNTSELMFPLALFLAVLGGAIAGVFAIKSK